MRKMIILLLALPLLQCVDPEEHCPGEEEVEKTGYDQFVNSNEKWYYHYIYQHTSSEYIDWKLYYHTLRDTEIVVHGEPADAKVLLERYQYEFAIGGDKQMIDSTAEIVFYYLRNSRTLMRMDMDESRLNLGFYPDLDDKDRCDLDILSKDDMVFGSSYFTTYTNELNQKIIEGISLGFYNCRLHPPFREMISIGSLHEMTYCSDQGSYEWTK